LGGRLDVLVKNTQGENLFVVELKAAKQKLTDNDAKQAISYARLLDQIAPFVVVSNGHESKVYDTITRKELSSDKIGEQSAFWANGRVLASGEDIRIRFEALKYFVGYSIENVKAFSKAQQTQRLQPLLGDKLERSKKYIPEIYIQRQKVRNAIELFIQGGGLSFAFVGESGVGKTNEMCALADALGEQHIALFLGAGSLCKGLAESLTDEFNWNFSDHLHEQELMQRLDELAKTAKCKVVILVDALDEAEVPLFEKSVSDFASRLSQFDGRIQLIVSVKSTEWLRFELFRGDATPLKLALDTSWQLTEGDKSQAGCDPKPFMLNPFTDKELDEAIPKYVKFFQLGGMPEGVLRDLCRSPFMMRVISEVYAGLGSLPQDMSEENLIDAWLKKKLDNVTDPFQTKSDLTAFAQSLYDKLCESPSKMMTMPEEEKVPETQVRKMISRPLNQELISQGIIVHHEDSCGRSSFSFYYGRVRDFVIARYLLELDQMDAEQFGDTAVKLLKNRILQSALMWHLRFAPNSHHQVLREYIGGQAALFLSTYQRILDELVPGLKPNISPYTSGEIGLAYVWRDGYLTYGLLPIDQNSVQKIYDLSHLSDREQIDREFNRLGSDGWRAGGVNFGNADPDVAAAEYALELIVKATENGRLDETGSDVIVKESVFAIASEHHSDLGLGDGKGHHKSILQSPLDLKRLDQCLQAFFGKRLYHNQWMQEQVDTKSKYVTINEGSNGIVSYHFTIDQQVFQDLSDKAKDEASQGKRFPLNLYRGEEYLEVLVEYVDLLRSRFSKIEFPIIHEAAVLVDHFSNADQHLSASQAKTVLEILFRESFIAYEQLVDANFPTLINSKRFMHLKTIILYSPQKPDKNGWEISYSQIKQSSEAPSIRVYLQPEDATLHYEGNQIFIRIDKKSIELDSIHFHGFGGLLSPNNSAGFRVYSGDFYGGHTNAHELAPIRARTYEWIKEDVKKLKAADLLQGLHKNNV